ncbi:MAG: hypothetical protein U0176_18620, partial [Bacteroidia bacterium]
MRDNTHQVTNSPSTLEAQEGMKTMKPPAFGLTDASDAEGSQDAGNIHASLTHQSAIEIINEGPPTELGLTTADVIVKNPVTSKEGDTFNISADFICWPRIQIWPAGKALGKYDNIEDENSPLINASNYVQIANSLRPNAGGHVFGKYWSRPITLKHEHFHANDLIARAEKNIPAAEEYLSKKKITSESEAEWELEDTADFLNNKIDEEMKADSPEERAYSDGAADYQKLHEAILKKGREGGYK